MGSTEREQEPIDPNAGAWERLFLGYVAQMREAGGEPMHRLARKNVSIEGESITHSFQVRLVPVVSDADGKMPVSLSVLAMQSDEIKAWAGCLVRWEMGRPHFAKADYTPSPHIGINNEEDFGDVLRFVGNALFKAPDNPGGQF